MSIILIVTILAILGCDKPDNEMVIPECVKEMITDFKNYEACDSGANVNEYIFQEKTVYVFNPGACGMDLASPVINSACTSLGFLGGFIGNTKINGEEFSNAIFIKTIWEN